MDQKKLLKNLRDPIVHWSVFLFIGLVILGLDYFLIQPLFIYVFELSKELAEYLSAGMAIIYMIIAHVCAKLLERGEWLLFTIGASIFLLIMGGSFIGQGVAQELSIISDPWGPFEDDLPVEEASPMASYRHAISVGLTIVLFSLAVFIEYLVVRTDEEVKDDRKKLSMSSLYRWFQSKITLLQGEFDRALLKLNVLAKDKVNERIENLNNQIAECERKERQLLGEQSYQEELIELMHQQRLIIIEAVYAKKPSFFKRIFS